MKSIPCKTGITFFLFLGLSLTACKKDKKDEEAAVAKKSFTFKINERSWEGKGSYMIAFGNNPPLFMLNSENDSSSFHLEFRATGPGTYTTIENGYYVSIPQQIIYRIVSGTVTLTEVKQDEIARGTFSLQAKDAASGKTVNITEGKFEDVKGSGHW